MDNKMLFKAKLRNPMTLDTWIEFSFGKLFKEKDILNKIEIKTIRRYTGLKDCEGNKIFIGDILNYFDTYVVIVEKGISILAQYVSSKGYIKNVSLNHIKNGVIVGNIYDNCDTIEKYNIDKILERCA